MSNKDIAIMFVITFVGGVLATVAAYAITERMA